jgi:DNA-directed RNA polymerase specialized sigma24 family protein
MGPRPSKLYSLDRIECNGDYEPGNCRWATRGVQNRNQRRHRLFEVNGKKLNLIDVSKEVGISMTTLQRRLKRGLSEQQAISSKDYRKCDRKCRLFLVNGKKLSLAEAAKEVGIAMSTIKRRLKRGLSEEQALSQKDYRRDSI